ncbi:MAG: AAA family ATPase [Nitrospira sp. BO4]|jgi:archaellum biogenesis ATPase FlaH|nr:AAA family ATPase [Nitrospira sp. BO4]
MMSESALTLRKPWEVQAASLEWAIDQIIPSGMLTLLSGKDKLGKTLLAWEFCRSVLHGTPFVGHFPAMQGTVVFLALDDPATVTIHRLDCLGLSEAANLEIATPGECDVANSLFWNDLGRAIDEIRPRLLIVDALYLMLPGGAESMNQAGGMAPVMNEFNKICESSGTAVLLITHDTKSGESVAGSFVIRAAAKQILRLAAVQNDEKTKRVLHVEGKLVERTEWMFHFKGPGEWTLGDIQAEELARTLAAVRGWLDQGQEGTSVDIAEALNKRRINVDIALKQLLEEGYAIAKRVQGAKGRPRIVYEKNYGPAPETLGMGQQMAG